MTTLSEYISQLRKQGYDDNYIKKYLNQYGFSEDQVTQTLGNKPVAPIKRHFLLPILLFIVALAAISFFLVQNDEALLDLSLEPRFTELPPGSQLGFTLDIVNLGSMEKFDVFVKYEILDNLLTSVAIMEETFAVSTSVSKYKTMQSPEVPGTYTLRTTANYDDKEATGSFSFTVKDVKPLEEPSIQDLLASVKELAKIQPGKAEALCLELEDKDDCLSLVVKESRRPEFCNNMIEDEVRDNCYMSFIVEGQSHLCSNIKLESNLEYCNRVKDIQILAKYYQD